MTRSALSVACASALAVATAGCLVGPNYKKPETTLAPAYSATQPASTQPTVEVPPVDLARWWETFNDPQLNKLVSDAIASNFDVQIAQARVRQARAQLDVAYGGLFPTVDGSVSYSRARPSKTSFSGINTGTNTSTGGTGGAGGGTTTGGGAGGGTIGNFGPTETDLFQGGFDAGWELDVFGGQRRTIEAAYGTLEAQIDSRRGAFVTLLSEVARNYILLRGYQYQLAIADKNIAAQADTVQLQQQKLQAGIATDLNVAQAQALLASTQAQRPTLQAQISQAIHRLGILMGEEPTALQTQLETASPLPVGPPSIPTGLPSELLRRRPDVRQAERTLAAATATIGAATAELFPKFSLNGSIGLSSAKFTNWGDSNSIFWSVGPSVSWRLFDAGAIKANIRLEEAARDEAMLTYRQTVYQAVSDVEDALVSYDREQDRTKALQASVDANRRALNLARQLNDAGVVDFLNVLQAQQALFNSEDALAQSEQTVSTNLVAVYKALGGGWETTETPPEPPLAPATQPVASR